MTSPLTTPATDGRWTPRLWGTLLVLCAAMFLDALDVSMVGVALPSIGSELDLSTSTLQWIVSGYILGYGGLLLLGGRTADLLGRRQVFLVALGVFALASLLGGLVDSGPLLIASRFVKGLSAAFTAPAGLSIITTTFAEGPLRNRALSIYTTCAATGFSMGLVLSGLLTEASWRLTMLLPAPVAVLALVAGLKLLPRSEREKDHNGYDVPGAILGTASMLLLVFTVVQAPQVGWASARTLLSFLAVAVLLTVFVRVERRSAGPLIRLGVLRSGPQIRAQLGALTLFGSYVGFQFLVTIYMQSLLGWSALHTALAFLPAGAIVALSATKMGAIVDRFGTQRLIVAGFVLMITGYALFLRVSLDPDYATLILPSMVLIGGAFALVFPSLNIQATNGVDDHEQGMVSGLLNTSVQVGGAIFLAVVTAVVTAGTPANPSPQAVLDAYRPGLIVVTGIALVGLLATLPGLRTRRPGRSVVVAKSVQQQEETAPEPVAARD
ncbi:MFS transporter [Streptomyces turgidiscabies]|uniref:Transporter, major facilitator family protein n=1 Tax=Streptomyces turgidiscabies (strain Car8) TaxID=698760 RepID=L7EW24_STRT8|nr:MULTISPECIES: MFS transporter [Streptomyces]ELP63593.1 transporter, major facilitator family protein [Streptomyces turgidiscabies Car8]MDX3496271.1 MFS transporter [Streptomyces turgidiscabies]GAQ74942.1 putative MFS-type transporter EfpA [Streptomyces turgidiscabies]